MKRMALIAMLLTMAGCNYADRLFSNHSYIIDQVATLPNGDEIGAGYEVRQAWGKTSTMRHFATWKRNDDYKELALQIEPAGNTQSPSETSTSRTTAIAPGSPTTEKPSPATISPLPSPFTAPTTSPTGPNPPNNF